MHFSAIRLIAASLVTLLAPALHAAKPQQFASPNQLPDGLGKSDWQSIRAAHESWKHQFKRVDGGWQARNPGQQWTTRFDGRGFTSTPDSASCTWGLEFHSYGFGKNLTEINGRSEVRADGQRLSYHWSDNVEEWYVNDQRGLEHGFILKERPHGGQAGDALAFTMSVTGSLKPSLSADRQTVHFRDAATAPVLTYSGLKAWDADGAILPSRFEVVGSTVRLLVEENAARYPITIDPIAQQAYLKPTIPLGYTGANDAFGSVSVSGDTVVVGARWEDSSTTGINSTPDEGARDSGAAYVFVRSGGTWSQQAYLKASQVTVDDNFGYAVAVSGETIIVGAYGEDSSSIGINSTPNEGANGAGAAYVFVRSGTTWSQQAYLKTSQVKASDNFGVSVAVSGDTVVVGADRENSSSTGINSTPNEGAVGAGAAFVFVRSGETWSQQAYLKASQVNADDIFGSSVAVSGETVVVGAYWEDSSTTGVNSTPDEDTRDSGAAYVFVRSGGTWSQQAYLKASQVSALDLFGYSVAVSGDTLVVGAFSEDSNTTGINSTPDEGASKAGAAYVFVRSGTMWSQQAYLKASQVNANDNFGYSVAVSGETVVVGAYGEDSSTTGINNTSDEGASGAGAAYVFVRSGAMWSQQAYLKASQVNANDSFGYSVAVSGDTVVVGAYGEDSSSIGINSTPNEGGSGAGSAYVFVRNGTMWSQQAYLKASQVNSGDWFGYSVSVSGDTVVVGAYWEDSSTTGINSTPNEGAVGAGAAYVFVRSGTMWSQQAYLKASQVHPLDQFGVSVAVSGDKVVVGADQEDSSTTGINSTPNEGASGAGAAYVFVRSGGNWSQQAYLKASQVNTNDNFGYSVAVSGDTVVVGARNEDSSSTGINSTPDEVFGVNGNAGAAYVFVRDGAVWSQQAYLKSSQVNANDNFGYSVAVSGETVVVGAYGEDSSTAGINSTANEVANNAGAAYIFTGLGPVPSAYSSWATSKGLTGAQGYENSENADPDNDGYNNLSEFALDGNPLSGANDGKVIGKVATVSESQILTLTLPVRDLANFPPGAGDRISDPIDGIIYRIEGDVNLSTFADTISEVTPALDAGLPVLSTGWTYRTFRAPGTVATTPRAFLRAVISETP